MMLQCYLYFSIESYRICLRSPREVSASGCYDSQKMVTLDLATVVQKTREYDKIQEMRRKEARKHVVRDGDVVHVIPPSGFVFHESRVGSTLVANSLTVMDPQGHRVYSESNPINQALKSYYCQQGGGDFSTTASCYTNMDSSVELFRDVVYMMGRTSSPKETHMFFKLASNGSKRIDVVEKAFPSVPWIFVYRDPVQTMMSHLEPTKMTEKNAQGGTRAPICLRYKTHPPEDLVQMVQDYEQDIDKLSSEEFCAVYLVSGML